MNIQKINLNQNFKAQIGWAFQRELDKKREEIRSATGKHRHVGIDRFEKVVEEIKTLFPTYMGKPVIVDIFNSGKMVRTPKGKIFQETNDYIIYTKDKSLNLVFDRRKDGKPTFDKYQYIIKVLKDLETKQEFQNKPLSTKFWMH